MYRARRLTLTSVCFVCVAVRGRAMEERIPLLRGKVGSEAKGMEKRLHVLSQEWEAGRPLSKDHTPSEVLTL